MRSDKWKVEQEHVFSRPELSLTWLVCLFQNCEYGGRDILEGRSCSMSQWAGSSFRRQETSVFFWASLCLLGELVWWEVRPFTSILEGPLYEEKRSTDETGSTSADAGPQDLLELWWFRFCHLALGEQIWLNELLPLKQREKKVTKKKSRPRLHLCNSTMKWQCTKRQVKAANQTAQQIHDFAVSERLRWPRTHLPLSSTEGSSLAVFLGPHVELVFKEKSLALKIGQERKAADYPSTFFLSP